jgi:hypothetical protein
MSESKVSGFLAYLYNSPAVIRLLVSRSFEMKAEGSISIDSSTNSPGTPTGYSVREGPLTGRPELAEALPEALAEVDIISGYIVFWEIDLLYFSSTIFSLAVSLPAYIWGL